MDMDAKKKVCWGDREVRKLSIYKEREVSSKMDVCTHSSCVVQFFSEKEGRLAQDGRTTWPRAEMAWSTGT